MIPSFRLSVAELASAMALSGNVEAAYGYLQTVLGNIEPDQANICPGSVTTSPEPGLGH